MKRLMILLSTIIMMGCTSGEPPTLNNSVSLNKPFVEWSDASGQWIDIETEGVWSAEIEYIDGEQGWASLSTTSGEGDGLVRLNYSQNTSAAERTLDVVVTFASETKSATLTQGSQANQNLVQLAVTDIAYDYVSNIAVTITSQVGWTAKLEYGNGASGWANLSETAGTGNGTIQLTPTENDSESGRTLSVVVSFADGDTKSASITQDWNKPPQPAPKWRELPEIVLPNDNYHFVIHYAPLYSGANARNYSMLYDASTYTAYWIAYPMSNDYMYGWEGGRSEIWDWDNVLDHSLQTNLGGGYGGGSGDEVNSRGHQVASDDRQGTKAQNIQTFFYSNMTPQKQGFNGGIWLDLENKIQGKFEPNKNVNNDTLWCVTGAILQTVGGNETITYLTNKNDGKRIPYPNYYYKVIIRKNGSTYSGIGFWFEHFDRTNWKADLGLKDIKTIDWIEEKTGFNFFYNLSEADQINAESVNDTSYWGF